MKNKNILILGGNTSNNLEWIKKFTKDFQKDNKVKNIKYNHWNTDKELDFELETNKVLNELNEFNTYSIIAKSVGSIITLKAIKNNLIKPENLIILGLPLMYIERKKIDINSLLDDAITKTNILIIQQKDDPIGKYDEVTKLISKDIKVISIPGHYHIYGNIKLIKEIINNEIK